MLLHGARIILTRPERDDAELAGLLTQEGAQTLSFPALVVQGHDEPVPDGPFDLAVFTSPAAVHFGLKRVRDRLPGHVAAPGRGTAERLREAGIGPVTAPSRGAGLAALLESPALGPRLSGLRVLLVCGRPLNRISLERLVSYGAEPVAFCVYERSGVTEPAPLEDWLRRDAADAIMVSSVAAVETLVALGERARLDWSGIDWIASSPRVAAAVKAGAGRVGAVAESADARALAAAASQWWSSKQQ